MAKGKIIRWKYGALDVKIYIQIYSSPHARKMKRVEVDVGF